MSHLRLHRKGARRSSLFVSAPATPERHRESEPLLMSQTIDYGNTSLNSVRLLSPPLPTSCAPPLCGRERYIPTTPPQTACIACALPTRNLFSVWRGALCVWLLEVRKNSISIFTHIFTNPSHISHPPQKRSARVQLHVHIRGDYCLIRFFFGGRGWVAGL